MKRLPAFFAVIGAIGLPCPHAAKAQAVPSACGPGTAEYRVSFDKDFHPSAGAPDPGSAKLYLIEVLNPADTGRINRPVIKQGVDGKWIGATQGFSSLMVPLSPGVHHLCAEWQEHSRSLPQQISLNLVDAQPGKSYYFRAQILTGVGPTFFLDLQPVNEDEGAFLVSQAAHAVAEAK